MATTRPSAVVIRASEIPAEKDLALPVPYRAMAYLDPKVYRGVVSSLIQKGALMVDEYDTMKDPRKGFLPMIAIAISFDTFNEIRKAAA